MNYRNMLTTVARTALRVFYAAYSHGVYVAKEFYSLAVDALETIRNFMTKPSNDQHVTSIPTGSYLYARKVPCFSGAGIKLSEPLYTPSKDAQESEEKRKREGERKAQRELYAKVCEERKNKSGVTNKFKSEATFAPLLNEFEQIAERESSPSIDEDEAPSCLDMLKNIPAVIYSNLPAMPVFRKTAQQANAESVRDRARNSLSQ